MLYPYAKIPIIITHLTLALHHLTTLSKSESKHLQKNIVNNLESIKRHIQQ
jgi:hypothetical protein